MEQKQLKRRLTFNGVIDGRRSKAVCRGENEEGGNGNSNGNGDDGGEMQRRMRTTTEAEVDEFFAIIRELHTAMKHLRKGKPTTTQSAAAAVSCNHKKKKKKKKEEEEKGASWRPVFECGDFEEIQGFKMDDHDDHHNRVVDLQQLSKEVKEKEKKITKMGFDLNEDPYDESTEDTN